MSFDCGMPMASSMSSEAGKGMESYGKLWNGGLELVELKRKMSGSQ
jgi:hypothetical protein